MLIGIPREIHKGERRVAATPDTAMRLMKLGHEVILETNAGRDANFPDASYVEVGVRIVPDALSLWSQADLILKVRGPEMNPTLDRHEADLIKEGGRLICFLWPGQNKDLLQKLALRKVTSLAMDCVPRISRAQKMDALSSMANIAGYRAVIEAAHHFGRFFTGQVTAAGKIPPAKVLVIGAGVAGLSAVGTAVSLGAIVRAFDTRPEVRDQVKSLGAEFLEVKLAEDGSGEGGYARTMSEAFIAAEMEIFAKQALEVDIIITTALVPGKEAPRLITSGMVESMREGSVIVDLAAAQGGNCALTVAEQVVERSGIRIVGFSDLPSRVPTQASQLYGTNLYHVVDEMTVNGIFSVDLKDEVIRGALITYEGQVTWPPPKPQVEPPKPPPVEHMEAFGKASPPAACPSGSRGLITAIAGLAAAVMLLLVGEYAPPKFLQHLTVFVLACFVGWQVVWSVTPALHTPLMSVTNAISGIIVIGALLQTSSGGPNLGNILAGLAIFLATINIAGGFLVTQRMLRMFQK